MRKNKHTKRHLVTLTQRKPIWFIVLSYVGVVLFAPFIFQYKWIRNAVINVRRLRAISDANDIAARTHKNAYVIQDGTHFKATTRRAARYTSNKVQSKLEKRHAGFLDYDYRNGVVYTAVNPAQR